MDFCAQPGRVNFCVQAAGLIKVGRLNRTFVNNRAEGTKVKPNGHKEIPKRIQARPGPARPSQSELSQSKQNRAWASQARSRVAKLGTAKTN